MFRRILLGVACVALAVAPAFAETADEVVAKYIKAQGGAEKLHATQTLFMSGTSTMSQGIQMPLARYSKRPNKMRVEFTFQGMTGIQAFDGLDAWGVMPFMGKTTPEVLPREESKRNAEQADIDGPLLDYKTKGNKVELLGKETVDSTEAWKLKVTLKNGDERFYYMDTKTGLCVRTSGKTMMRGVETEFITTMRDYKDVNGRLMPFTIENGASGTDMKQTFVIEKVEINKEIPDSLFAVPANATRLPSADSLQAKVPKGESEEAEAKEREEKAKEAAAPKTTTAKKKKG
jgi:outer membrane lipoprotein-sorting protein